MQFAQRACRQLLKHISTLTSHIFCCFSNNDTRTTKGDEGKANTRHLTSLFPNSRQRSRNSRSVLELSLVMELELAMEQELELKPGGDITCMIDCAVVQCSAQRVLYSIYVCGLVKGMEGGGAHRCHNRLS